MKVASFFICTLYSSSSPRVESPPARRGISIMSARKPSGYSRASGTSLFEVSNATSLGAQRRLSPDIWPSLKGSQLNSTGSTAPNMIRLAATNAQPEIASMRPAGNGFEICPSVDTSGSPRAEIAGELVFDQHESRGQDQRICCDCIALEARAAPPLQHDDEKHRKRDELADLDPDVEADHIGHKAIPAQTQRLKLGGEAEAVDQPETRDRNFVVRLHAEYRFEAAEIVERLVGHRKADDGIDHIGVDVDLEQHAGEQRDAVADRKQRHVDEDVAQAIQEEDHPEDEQQVIVSGHHVLCAKIHERQEVRPLGGGDEGRIASAHAVREGDAGAIGEEHAQNGKRHNPTVKMPAAEVRSVGPFSCRRIVRPVCAHGSPP